MLLVIVYTFFSTVEFLLICDKPKFTSQNIFRENSTENGVNKTYLKSTEISLIPYKRFHCLKFIFKINTCERKKNHFHFLHFHLINVPHKNDGLQITKHRIIQPKILRILLCFEYKNIPLKGFCRRPAICLILKHCL